MQQIHIYKNNLSSNHMYQIFPNKNKIEEYRMKRIIKNAKIY